MSIPRHVQVGPLVAAVANGYATSQSGTGGTALTLNGSLVTGGVGIPDLPRRVIITSSGNDSGITFTITGQMVLNGPIVTEVMTGGNVGAATSFAGAAYSALDFAHVISIVPSGNTAGTVTAGTNGVASSPWIRLDNFSYPPVALAVEVTGTVSYTVEAAYRSPSPPGLNNLGINVLLPYQVIWQPHSVLNAQTITNQGNYAQVPLWVRCTLASGTGTCVFTAIQPADAMG